MSKQQVFVNSTTSIIQMFLSAFIIFFQYKFLYNTLGVSNLGIWSLVLSVNFFFGVSGFGMQGSIIKFVSKYYSQNNRKKTVAVIQTAFSSMTVFSITGALAIYPVTAYALKFAVDPVSYTIVCKILPIAFVSFVISMIGSIPVSVLDGLNKIYIRNFVMFFVTLQSFISVLLFTPKWGLTGLMFIKLVESVLILFSTLLLTKKYLKELPIIPIRWNKTVFKEIIGYSVKFQIINFSVILSEPLVRFLLSKFDGIAYVGIYELANKLVMQTRSFIVAAYQSLVPAVASYQETEPEKIPEFYMSTYKFLFLMCVPIFTLLTIAAPVISKIWIGEMNIRFIFTLSILSIAWLVNSIAVSAYFTNMGTGEIHDNVVSHIIVGLLNVVLGLLFGFLFAGKGVAVAVSIGVIVGGLYQLILFHKKNGFLRLVIPNEVVKMSILSLILVIFYIIILQLSSIHSSNFLLYNSTLLFISIFLISIVLLKNKIFKNILTYAFSKILKVGTGK